MAKVFYKGVEIQESLFTLLVLAVLAIAIRLMRIASGLAVLLVWPAGLYLMVIGYNGHSPLSIGFAMATVVVIGGALFFIADVLRDALRDSL